MVAPSWQQLSTASHARPLKYGHPAGGGHVPPGHDSMQVAVVSHAPIWQSALTAQGMSPSPPVQRPLEHVPKSHEPLHG